MGLESGDNKTLRLMNKKTTVESSIRAVYTLHDSGIKGAVFLSSDVPERQRIPLKRRFPSPFRCRWRISHSMFLSPCPAPLSIHA
jgi:hypothetical protein